MRTILARRSVQLGLAILIVVVVAGGIGVGIRHALGSSSTVAGYALGDFTAALRAHGATVVDTGTVSAQPFQGIGHGLDVNGVPLVVYAYPSTGAASLDAQAVSPDGSTVRRGSGPLSGQTVVVDWVAPPHLYLRGRVIVTYAGSDLGIIHLLMAILGPQFAGSPNPTDDGYLWLVRRLQQAGAGVQLVQQQPGTVMIVQSAPRADQYEVRVNGTIVSAYEFPDNASATIVASHVNGGDYADPATHQYVTVEYAAPPHFFRHGRVIVLYVGRDSHMLQLLTSVLGPPFTEEHW
jgi:hypothetical protein